jgi:hypothetical protein
MATPAALRTSWMVSEPARPRPMSRRRCASAPAGEWSRRVSPSEALNSPVASQGAAALASVSEVASSAGEGLVSSPGALGAGYGGFGFLVAFAGALGGALVPVLFALGEGEFALDAAVAEIKFDGDERVAFLLRQTLEFVDFTLVQKEFAGAQGSWFMALPWEKGPMWALRRKHSPSLRRP